jgi:hypothetical protein
MSFGPKFSFERGPMMGPAILPMALVAGIAGAGISAYGSYESMEARSANAAYQARVAANNAKIAQQNAAMDIQSGEIQAANQGLKTRAAVGTIKAQEAAQGVDVNTGSFPHVRAAASEIGNARCPDTAVRCGQGGLWAGGCRHRRDGGKRITDSGIFAGSIGGAGRCVGIIAQLGVERRQHLCEVSARRESYR